MQRNAMFGWVVFIVLAVVGFMFFRDYRQKADTTAQSNAYAYVTSLMKEDTSINKENPAGGPPVHPWVLTATPPQAEFEDKIGIDRKSNGDSFSYDIKADPAGGKDVKDFHVVVTYDQQGNLSTVSGIHGTVTSAVGGWLPQ